MFAKLERIGYIALLVFLTALFVVSPIIHDEYYGIVFETYLFCIVLFCSVMSLNPKRWVKNLALITAVTTSILWYLSHLFDDPLFNSTNFHLVVDFAAIFYLVIVSSLILKDVLISKYVNANLLCGSVCLYLLIGLIFSVNYHVALLLDPNAITSTIDGVSFAKNIDLHTEGLTIRYFSFVTLTTLGYGDLCPTNNLARTMAWVEGVIGQVYLTILVARLVGLHIAFKTVEITNASENS